MARIRTDTKRLWLVTVYDAAVAASATLLATIKSEASTALGQIKGGTIASTSGNGFSVAFSAPGAASVSGDDIANLCGEMLRRYDEASAALIAEGNPTPTDAQIYGRMLLCLRGTPNFISDFSSPLTS